MFLNDDKVVFSLFIILFTFSRFNFCPCVRVYFGFCCALFGCVAFTFYEVGGSFLFGCFCLLIFDVTGMVLLSCSLYIFCCISRISWSENQPLYYPSDLVDLSLDCLLKYSTFEPDLCLSFPISSLWRVSAKIAMLCKLVLFLSPCFMWTSLFGVVP